MTAPRPPTLHAQYDAIDALTDGLSYDTARKLRTCVRNALDVARSRDDAMRCHMLDTAAFDAMAPCDHPGLSQPSGCSYCAVSQDLDRQERHIHRLDQMLDRRY